MGRRDCSSGRKCGPCSTCRGSPGPQGLQGATGPSVGTIIPFSSGNITTAPGNTTGSIGFGTHGPIANFGPPFFGTGTLYFTAPRAGTLTELTAELVIFIPEALATGNATVYVLTGAPASGALSIVASTTLTFSASSLFTLAFPSTALSIPVVLGQQIEVGFSINSTADVSFTANVNGGLLIN